VALSREAPDNGEIDMGEEEDGPGPEAQPKPETQPVPVAAPANVMGGIFLIGCGLCLLLVGGGCTGLLIFMMVAAAAARAAARCSSSRWRSRAPAFLRSFRVSAWPGGGGVKGLAERDQLR
jgi:hypothetical protein